ncbi:hypothetical protein ACFJIY_00295 [Pimelobacter simplex]|uniref:hypothetical protein n=1 Tax=Nocardioides simplex TaxID=2045 RepID=UPI0036724786
MSRPTPRRPASSRGQTPRPRKIAGQAAGVPRPADDAAAESAEPTESAESAEPAPAEKPAPTPRTGGRPGVLARPKTTRVLIATLVLVTLALVAEFAVLALDKLGDDDKDATAADGTTSLSVPKGRPVVAATLQTRDGVEAAAKAAQEIVAVDFKKYDDEVANAAKLMTARFEKQYRETAVEIKEQVVGQQTVVQASVVAQGVVRASRTRLEALIFLNQVVERTREGKKETVVTPFKVLVTMVHTDHGWLVDKLDTDASDGAAQPGATAPAESPSVNEDKTN